MSEVELVQPMARSRRAPVRRRRASNGIGVLLAFASTLFGAPARAEEQQPPPKVTVFDVGWTTAGLAIELTKNLQRCIVHYGEEATKNRVVAKGPLEGQVAEIIGLRPNTEYRYWVLCSGSPAAKGKFRTGSAPGPLPTMPVVLTTSFTQITPGKLSKAAASFATPTTAPSACWWESFDASLWLSASQDFDCTLLNGVSPPVVFSTGKRVVFVVRNAAGEARGALSTVP